MIIPVDDSTDLSCDVRGHGRPVVFVHGFPLRGLMWARTAAMRPANRRAIVPDLRGHGASPPARSLRIERMADDLVEILDALGIAGPADFVGLSMGGIIALDLWRRHPARVSSLVLCCTRADAESPEGAALRRSVADRALREGSAPVIDAMLPRVLGSGVDPAVRGLWRGLMAKTSPATIAAASIALAKRRDSTGLLGTISCPTLVVAGEHDVITPPASMERIRDAIPGSRYAMIAASGHIPPVEQPTAFSEALNDFLTEIDPVTPLDRRA
ncbi:MAG: alpha/beta fold hydrolase [Phycisphaeraceae bacterium]|nr:alpha/beta fold hydrolase [Phycisphaerae bacterium]MBX3391786.1 alpha/beta fold hydrolase [Phycisphaeraceae bacterium]